MKENLYLTANPDYFRLQNISEGLIMGILPETLFNQKIWAAKVYEWRDPEKSFFSSYSDIETALAETGLFVTTSSLPAGMYAVSVSESTVISTITSVANTLEYNYYFNPIILD